MKDLPVIFIGGGGHARVLLSLVQHLNLKLRGYVDIQKTALSNLGVEYIGNDQGILSLNPLEFLLVNAIGSIKSTALRTSLFVQYKNAGFSFPTLVHPRAFVASDTKLGEGVQVMAGVVVQPGCTVGNNVVLNTSCVVDHDCKIYDHVHIAPGAVISGSVTLGESVHFGTGATAIQGIEIGDRAVIGAGSVVIRNVSTGVTVVGNPGRELY